MRIFAEEALLPTGWAARTRVTVEGRRIVSIETAASERDADLRCERLTPGYFDTHIHGGYGYDLDTKSFPELESFLERLLLHGVTDLLMTTTSDTWDGYLEQLDFIQRAMVRQREGSLKGATIRGIHFEGPDLSPRHGGAMPLRYFAELNETRLTELFERLLEPRGFLVTLAPERPGADDAIRRLLAQGCHVQAGHSDADYEQGRVAFDRGVTSLCHCFNAMTGIHHRAPGMVTAALLDDRVFLELISDTIHIHPAVMTMVYRLGGPGRVILVSDSTKTTGFPDGHYESGGHPVIIENGIKRTDRGNLAGGNVMLDGAVQNFLKMGIPMADAVTMASLTPSREMGFEDQFGSIEPGLEARFLAQDSTGQIAAVILGEEIMDVGRGAR